MLMFLLLSGAATCSSSAAASAAKQQPNKQGQEDDSRRRRAGDVAELEDGRISLARVSMMLSSSVHTEVSSVGVSLL